MTMMNRLKRAFGGRPAIPEAAAPWADHERVFRAPPLTEELISAIRLIAPQFDLSPDDKSRIVWERDQNAASRSELEALKSLFDTLPKPNRILEIGPGLGRSLVYFTKTLGWQDADIHAYEGEGSSTKYTKLGPRFEDSFCGNPQMLRGVLAYNGIGNVTLHDARSVALGALPGPFDLIYSFYSIGFHWSLEHFLDDILPLISGEGTAIFTVPSHFEPFPRLQEQYFELIPLFPDARKANRRHTLLALRKAPFPDTSKSAVRP